MSKCIVRLNQVYLLLMPKQEEQYYNYYNTTNMKSRPIVEVVDSRIKYLYIPCTYSNLDDMIAKNLVHT